MFTNLHHLTHTAQMQSSDLSDNRDEVWTPPPAQTEELPEGLIADEI